MCTTMKRIKLFAILWLLCGISVNAYCQYKHHYEVSYVRENVGFVNVEYMDSIKFKSDTVKIYVHSDFGPCKNADVTLTCNNDTLVGKTDSLGMFYLSRKWQWRWNSGTFKISVRTKDERVLPYEQRIEFWGLEARSIPIQITVKLETANQYIIHILSRKPLDSGDIESIRTRIFKNPAKRPRIRGIEYLAVMPL